MKHQNYHLLKLASDNSQGPVLSIFNERTMGRMIVDLKMNIIVVCILVLDRHSPNEIE